MNQKPKVIVVLPALNAEKTLEKTIADIDKNIVDEIILVDDASTDGTVALAHKIGLTVLAHTHRLGYGGNQKTCYKTALEHGADIVVMIHPDYQYDPKVTKYLVGFIAEGRSDVMLGSRIRSRAEALAGGMPPYKYINNRVLTFLENILSGYNLSEWHSGMRAYSREVLENVDFQNNSNDFVFDTQFLFKTIALGYKIGEIPIPVRYSSVSSSINFKRSLRYGVLSLLIGFKFFCKRLVNKKQKRASEK